MKRKLWKKARSASRAGFFKRKSGSKSNGESLMGIVLAGGAYGAIRAPIARAVDPLTQKIPVAGLADEIGMAIISYVAYKKGNGFIKKLGKAGLYVEAARTGDYAVNVGINAFTGSNNTSTSSGIFV